MFACPLNRNIPASPSLAAYSIVPLALAGQVASLGERSGRFLNCFFKLMESEHHKSCC